MSAASAGASAGVVGRMALRANQSSTVSLHPRNRGARTRRFIVIRINMGLGRGTNSSPLCPASGRVPLRETRITRLFLLQAASAMKQRNTITQIVLLETPERVLSWPLVV